MWKEIKGFEQYLINELGVIKHIKWGEKATYKYNGYNMVHLRDKKTGLFNTKPVHKIVAETFVNNPKNEKYIIHKDRNKNNDSAKNLMWVNKTTCINYYK